MVHSSVCDPLYSTGHLLHSTGHPLHSTGHPLQTPLFISYTQLVIPSRLHGHPLIHWSSLTLNWSSLTLNWSSLTDSKVIPLSTGHPIQTPWSSPHPLVIPYRLHGHLLQTYPHLWSSLTDSTDHPLKSPLVIVSLSSCIHPTFFQSSLCH
ncbi:hypothetical protein BgiBS90_015746 [Biomphalaria glabrata]|nr:hypothetical protein BgiBS90_015746 [Biomphalaria glabrata]